MMRVLESFTVMNGLFELGLFKSYAMDNVFAFSTEPIAFLGRTSKQMPTSTSLLAMMEIGDTYGTWRALDITYNRHF
jgi:hypothetical protein